MDKYEFQIKTEQMDKLYDRQDYKTAAKIADTIDWRKVRDVEMLTRVSEIYEKLERYEDSYEVLNIAYDCSPIGRVIVYRMTEIAVKMKDFDEAVELYKEFIRIAPHDLGRYVLKYEIYKGRGSSIEDQIAILEEYKSREYQEQWAYELATLYYKEGMLSKCVEECDDLILWFSDGEYVIKAMELKKRIQPLTASQEEKYRSLTEGAAAERIHVPPVNMGEFNTTNLQAALAEGLHNYIDEKETPDVFAEDSTADAQDEPGSQKAEEEFAAETAPEESPLGGWAPVKEDTLRLPKFLGQDESGQITFDMQENVLERQITGQLTIEDIMNSWEEKKKETEAAIEEAARRDEERRAARARMRETGELPPLNAEVPKTLPDEIQRLIDEIEGRYPIKLHVEAAEGDGADTVDVSEKPAVEDEAKPEAPANDKPPVETQKLPDIMDVLETQEESDAEQEPPALCETAKLPDIMDILSASAGAETIDEAEETDIAQESDAAQNKAEREPDTDAETAEPESAPETASDGEGAAPTKMLKDLEKSLEAEVSSLPAAGQLTEEQEKLFAYFTSVRGMNRQLAELLEEDRMRGRREDSLLGNIVVTGEGGTGKSTLAEDIVKALQKQRRVKGSRMARISADKLNEKDVSAVIEKLGGGALLVEKAGSMKTKTAVQLSHAMTRKTGGLLVILEDDKEEIRKLFIRCESLGAKFTRTIDIPVFTNKELVAFGESYAEEKECVLDEMAVLALYNRIGNRQTSDHLVNVAEVKEMIDNAINKGGKKGLFGKVKRSRRDEFGHTILLEKDFE